MGSNRNTAGNLSAVASRASEDTSVQDFAESQESFHDTASQSDHCSSHVETWVIHLMAGLTRGDSKHLLQSFPRVSGQLLLCVTLPRVLLQHPPSELGNNTAVNLLSQYITRNWAYMFSSPFPAATTSLDTLAKLLRNVKDSLWSKAFQLWQW